MYDGERNIPYAFSCFGNSTVLGECSVLKVGKFLEFLPKVKKLNQLCDVVCKCTESACYYYNSTDSHLFSCFIPLDSPQGSGAFEGYDFAYIKAIHKPQDQVELLALELIHCSISPRSKITEMSNNESIFKQYMLIVDTLAGKLPEEHTTLLKKIIPWVLCPLSTGLLHKKEYEVKTKYGMIPSYLKAFSVGRLKYELMAKRTGN